MDPALELAINIYLIGFILSCQLLIWLKRTGRGVASDQRGLVVLRCMAWPIWFFLALGRR